MSNDRELLEFAAKAAGLIGLDWREGSCCFYYDDPKTGREEWNPLSDDGQAFRLAVKLGITVERDQYDGEYYAQAVPPGTHKGYYEPHGDDATAATRRAIVRAAAGIGKAMP